MGGSVTITCTEEVARWVDHLHHASSLDALDCLQVIVGEPLHGLPHITHSPVPSDMVAGRIFKASSAKEAEEHILKMYAEEVELNELALAVAAIKEEEPAIKLPRQEVAGQMGTAELPIGEE